MGIVAEERPTSLATEPRDRRKSGIGALVVVILAAIPQALCGLLPRTCHRLLLGLIGSQADEWPGRKLRVQSVAGLVVALTLLIVNQAVSTIYSSINQDIEPLRSVVG